MRRSTPLSWLFAFALVALAPLLLPPRVLAADEAPKVKGVRGEVIWFLNDAESKLLQLADATPAAKFSYRPGEGVRSFGEVLLHVAGANYLFPGAWGAKPPVGVDPRTIEKAGADHDKAVATLKASFAYVREQIMALNDTDLDREIEFFGHKMTVRALVLVSATHAHEHLGQAIAYSRVNGIVPPWSKKAGD
jgi:uncharacterized damage-inducible protein DinB